MGQQFIKFAIVGVLGFVTDLLIFYFLVFMNIEGLLARVSAFWCATIITCFGNRFFTFAAYDSDWFKQFIRHLSVSHFFGMINISVFYYLSLIAPLFLAFLVGTAIAMLGNYTFSKFWVFSEKAAT
ncbi:GtrA family protein [Pseudoalteromonas sp. MTN2-4]|uniref:GtrA family protein n=1 Tax=Pseudoalteromonas sp. MTN2-4 TaxID=3056555 RepID=UPI0036F21500